MKDNEVLIVEISGKRPGGQRQRPTEKFRTKFDHIIISNDSTGYETEWTIINVPQDYREWYKKNHKLSDTAWYAPMNRSYAIKYAKDNGYKYLIQVDDNIESIDINYIIENRKYHICNRQMFDDFIKMLVCILENTNAVMSGMRMKNTMPGHTFLTERYCYSFFALKLAECPEIFSGGFEDDIEYRLKCAEKGLPTVMICPMAYGKTAQVCQKDETGNRAAYTDAGVNRGREMRKLHGAYYSCGLAGSTMGTRGSKGVFFRHQLKPFKIGVIIYDKGKIEKLFKSILKKYHPTVSDKISIKKRKV